MKTTVGELRSLIREAIEASESDVQAKLAEFDKQFEPLRNLTGKDYRFEFDFDGMKFGGFHSRTEPKPYSIYVDGYQVGTFKNPADAFALAKKKYEKKVRKDLKVKVDPSVKAAELAAKEEKAHARDVASAWKNGHLSAMTDSNGKRFDPNKRFK